MDALSDLAASSWTGRAELWLDPLGDQPEWSDCTIAIEPSAIRYAWTREGAAHEGRIAIGADGAEFTDTWHQPEPMRCRRLPEARGLVQVEGRYGPDGSWGWRIALVLREPTGELVLQMTNIAPWGEESRAVRMTCSRDDS